jgi:hypothetical protein
VFRVRYFYLSYAQADDEDRYVATFFADLSEQVRSRVGASSPDEVGFRTEHDSLSSSAHAVAELSDCRTFVALCSPRYFNSAACGREWAFFSQRIAEHEAGTGQVASRLLLPVLWAPTQLPPVVAAIQSAGSLLGRGFVPPDDVLNLVRIAANRREYLGFLTGLAGLIVDGAERVELPAYTWSGALDDVRPAFPDPVEPVTSPLRSKGADDVPDLDALLATPDVHLIVDASDAAAWVLGTAPPRDRNAWLLRGLSRIAGRNLAEVTAVFDGTDSTAVPQVPGVRVMYTPTESSVDQFVRQLILAQRPGRPVAVISSDCVVAEVAIAAGAHSVAARTLLQWLTPLPLSGGGAGCPRWP